MNLNKNILNDNQIEPQADGRETMDLKNLSFHEKRCKVRDLKQLQEFQEHHPLMQENFFIQLLEGKLNPEEISQTTEKLELNLNSPYYLITQLNYSSESMGKLWQSTAISQLFQSYFHWSLDSYLCHYHHDTLICCIGLSTKEDSDSLLQELNHLCQLAQDYLKLNLRIGVGLPYEDISKLPLSAQEAKNALDYHAIFQQGKAYSFKDGKSKEKNMLMFEKNQEQALIRAIKFGSEKEIAQQVNSNIQLLSKSEVSLGQSQLYFMELLTCILKLVYSLDLNPTLVLEDEFARKHISTFSTPQNLETWLCAQCEKIQKTYLKQQNDNLGSTIEKAKIYISEYYGQSNLSVETLCKHLHLSPTYFSTLFKRETGTNFISYVTEVRMEQAKHLLLTTQDKTYLIGEKVGYLDSNYFSYVFKKQFGTSPAKFRKAQQLGAV